MFRIRVELLIVVGALDSVRVLEAGRVAIILLVRAIFKNTRSRARRSLMISMLTLSINTWVISRLIVAATAKVLVRLFISVRATLRELHRELSFDQVLPLIDNLSQLVCLSSSTLIIHHVIIDLLLFRVK